jgi:hypothetical protein
MNNYEYYELDDYVDPNDPEQVYIREAGRGMQMDDLQEKIKAMEELEPSDNEEDNEHRRVTINILKDRYKELEQKIEKELESLYAEHNDLVKKQNLLYERLAEIEKRN